MTKCTEYIAQGRETCCFSGLWLNELKPRSLNKDAEFGVAMLAVLLPVLAIGQILEIHETERIF